MKIRHFFLLLLIFFVLWIYFTSDYRTFKISKFSSEVWKNYDIHKCERKKMLYDLNKNYLYKGVHKKEIEKILGKIEVFNRSRYYLLCDSKQPKNPRNGFIGSFYLIFKNKKLESAYYCSDDFCDFKKFFIK